MPSNRIKTVAGGGAFALAAITAAAPTAFAAVNTHPKAGQYAQMADNDSFLMKFTLSKHKISDAAHYDDCVSVPLMMPKIKVDEGRFHYRGTREDALGDKFKVRLTGKFVTRTKAKGVWEAEKLTGESCTSSFNFKVKRIGPVS